MDMLTVLGEAERELPKLLHDGQPWNTLFVDYHKPFVERLWRQWGEYRISLHRIYPCSAQSVLFHPHPWPSAMRLVNGVYEMAIGYREYGRDHLQPPVAARLVLSAPDTYEMVDPGSWHSVRPLNGPSLSVMVSGRPIWRYPESDHSELKPLSKDKADRLLARFQKHYLRPE